MVKDQETGRAYEKKTEKKNRKATEIQDSRFKIQDPRFMNQDLRFKFHDSRSKIHESRFKIHDSRLKIQESKPKTSNFTKPNTLKFHSVITFTSNCKRCILLNDPSTSRQSASVNT